VPDATPGWIELILFSSFCFSLLSKCSAVNMCHFGNKKQTIKVIENVSVSENMDLYDL
jgi:hypothetical protein